MSNSRFLKVGLVVAAALILAGCDSAEERAEEHYQSALELLERGDVERALVEFRNVLSLDELHTEARAAYAQSVRNLGNIPESYGQYLRVVEQQPANMEARLALAEIAILAQNWEEAERHGRALEESGIDNPAAKVVGLALRFRQAALTDNAPLIRDITREAAALATDRPNDQILQLVLIEGYTRANDTDAALSVIQDAIDSAPDERKFYMMKASILNARQDTEALEALLREMIQRFPEDPLVQSSLVRLLASQGQIDRAAEFLRDQLRDAENKTGSHVGLITFLRQTEGNEAALAEIDTAIDAYEDNRIFRALKSGILFDQGQRNEAVSLMQTIVDAAEPGEETNRYKVTLAKMLAAIQNEVGARQLIEDVLSDDPSQADALKMSAEWMINSDKADEAIGALRQVLDQSPNDSEAMTLMAQAHQRNGNTELAQDLLALAVEASENAPEESLRFAQLLLRQKQYRPAEDVLVNALRASPGNTPLLEMLGELHLATEDYPRALQVEATLRRLEDDRATRLADRLRLQIVTQRDGRDQAVAYLEQLATQEGSENAARVGLLQARLADGDADGAVALAEQLVSENADNPRLRLLLGNTQLALRNYDAAESEFRKLVADNKDDQGAWIQLVRVLSAKGNPDSARTVVDEALAANPGSPNLLWAKASFLESANDVDGAISIYQDLYDQNPSSQIIANNLASLLATYREDDESLELAFAVARRLRGTTAAPFQDTYGWILFRRNEIEEALTYLEPAAAGLPKDPIVQYHLAKAYVASERNDDALEAFKRAVEAAGESDKRPQIEEARAEVTRLSE